MAESNDTQIDLTPDIKVKNLTFGSDVYSASKLSSLLSNIQQKLDLLIGIVQNIDSAGNLYLPIGKSNGTQKYKRLTSYLEDETGLTLPDVSTSTYIRTSTGNFQEVNNA